MAEFEWRPDDVRDLARRDRLRVVASSLPFPVVAAVFAVWLRSGAPGLAAVFAGMSLAWTLSLLFQLRAVGRAWRDYVNAQGRPQWVDLGAAGIAWRIPHGTTFLAWDGIGVRLVGRTWVLSVNGAEAAHLPSRVLADAEVQRLRTKAQDSA